MRKQPPAAEWGERPREKVTVMPGRRGNAARGAKSDTLCAVPVGFAIPEAEMRGAAHGHLGRAFFVCGGVFAAPESGECGGTPGRAVERKIFHKGISLYALLISKAWLIRKPVFVSRTTYVVVVFFPWAGGGAAPPATPQKFRPQGLLI